MLIFAEARLAYLATPKTGTTAVEMALRPKADVIFAKQRKHITADRYRSAIAPFLRDSLRIETETVAVMRDPIDQIRSWYKYRARDEISGKPRSTQGSSFDDYLKAVASASPPENARIGSQHAFLTDDHGALAVDHLFSYENQALFLDFLSDRLGFPVALKQKNVSPDIPALASPDAVASLHKARADEVALYDRLNKAGGYLGAA